MGRWRSIGSTVRGDAAVLVDVCCQLLVVRWQVMEVVFELRECCHVRVAAVVVVSGDQMNAQVGLGSIFLRPN